MINTIEYKKLKKKVKIVTAGSPNQLENAINSEINLLYNNKSEIIDIKYSISSEVGSAIIIYE